MTPKFAIVTESYNAVAPWPFMAQLRCATGMKSAAYNAAELIRSSAHIHPALGLRFQPFSIRDAKGYEVAYVTAKGEVYYEVAIHNMGQFTGAVHYILQAALNAIEEVRQNNVRRD